jgi:hypothetical protein
MKSFSFEIWGKTFEVAEHLEVHGKVGTVHASDATVQNVKKLDRYTLENHTPAVEWQSKQIRSFDVSSIHPT